jgi:hypothetical protein
MPEYVKLAFRHYRRTAAIPKMSILGLPNTVRITAMRLQDELHQVRYFLAVANTLNFTRAAEMCTLPRSRPNVRP